MSFPDSLPDIGLRELAREGLYPYGPMSEEQRRYWSHVPHTMSASDWDRVRAYERARAEHRASASATATRLGSYDRRPLVNLSSSVAVGPGGERDARRKDELRRQRHRMRAAAQRAVRVETVRGAPSVGELVDEGTGEVLDVPLPGKVSRKRLGQKLCGRATSMALPARGEKMAGGKAQRAESVELMQRPDGSVTLRNVYRCGSVWCCPVCSYAIARERGTEVQRVFEELHGRGAGAYLLTLTARHWRGMDLRMLRSTIAGCWRKIRQRREWRAICRDLGYVGDLRALEVTHGPHGWHPHLHILVWTRRELTGREAARARRWLRRVWCDAMERETGARPTRAHGVHAQRVHARADYLVKLGIAAELTSAVTKEGRGEGHRSVWEILRDLTAGGRPAEVELWREWSEGIHGARQLTWSGKELKALRAALGIEDESDEALAEREAEGGHLIAEIPTPMFARLEAQLPGFALWLCERAERMGGRGLVDSVRWLNDELMETGKPPSWWRGWGGPSWPGNTTSKGGGDASV